MVQKNSQTIVELVHNYAHVVVSLNETRKRMKLDISESHHAAAAINNTIKGVCGLIDTLVAQEQRNQAVSETVLS